MKLLIVLHELSRTGSPLVMLNFVRWLKDHTSYHLTILALKSGELKEDFEQVTNDLFIEPTPVPKKFAERLKSRVLPVKDIKEVFYDQLNQRSFDLIYANSVPTFNRAQQLSQHTGSKLLCHLHEAKTMLSLLDRSWMKRTDLIDEFIAPSLLVSTAIEAEIKNIKAPIHIIRETPANKIEEKFSPKKQFIVGGSGTVHWRKGPDLFLQVAVHFFKKNPEASLKFQWLGRIDQESKIIFEHDIEKTGLKGKVEFKDATAQVIEVYQEFSVFLLTSREDPYPLVCIENGLLGNPLITFEGATGINETIANGGGTIVPYLDTVAMADAVELYFENKDILKEASEKVKRSFKTSNFDMVFPALNKIISKYGS